MDIKDYQLCVRCQGTLLYQFDQYGSYHTCMRCGAHTEQLARPEADEQLRRKLQSDGRAWNDSQGQRHRKKQQR